MSRPRRLGRQHRAHGIGRERVNAHAVDGVSWQYHHIATTNGFGRGGDAFGQAILARAIDHRAHLILSIISTTAEVSHPRP